MLVGLAFGFAYSGNRLRTAAIAIIWAGLIELLQLVVPGRHALLRDFIIDALGGRLESSLPPAQIG
jgi:VanZ family protein